MDADIHLIIAGYRDRLDGRAVFSAGLVFLSLLKELDIALSSDVRGTIQWELSVMKKASPADIGFIGHSKLENRDLAPEVERRCISGIGLLGERPERDPHYSDAALKKVRTLASFRRRRQFTELHVRTADGEVSIEPAIATHIDELTKPLDEADGSVVGNLDSISVHRGNEFRVWDEVSGKAVTCRFPDPLLSAAKLHLKRRVLVYGVVRTNQLGDVASMLAEGIDEYPSDEELPSIHEVSGSVDIMGDLSLRDYARLMREE